MTTEPPITIRVLAIGDVMGKAGRKALDVLLPLARETYKPDFVMINAENTAGGFGLTKKIYDRFVNTNHIDCLTMGNHWHDKKEIHQFVDEVDNIVLPANMANVNNPARGLKIFNIEKGGQTHQIAVGNLIGKALMKGDNLCPYEFSDKLMDLIPASAKVKIVDVHAEATSEKQGLAHYLTGRVSLLYGTHSHVPTADLRLLGGHTGYLTDLGLTGAYDSVIGVRKDAAITRMRTGVKKNWQPASGDIQLWGVFAEFDTDSGKCCELEQVQLRLDS